jgi:hypothetical protein
MPTPSRIRLLVAATMTAVISPLAAQTDLSIGLRVGTLGLGAEVAKLVTPNLGVRVGAYTLSKGFTRTESDVEYAVDIGFKGITGLVDLFPSRRGTFHLTGGFMTAPAEIDGVGQPTEGTYTFNGRDYTAAEVGTVRGDLRWPGTMPYVGLGWGTPASRHGGGLAFVFDLGVGFGTPTLGLSASSAVPGSTLAADVEAERRDIQDDIDRYLKVYPVLSLGLALRF